MLTPLVQLKNMHDSSKYSYQDCSSEDSPASSQEPFSSPPAEQLPQKKKPGRKPNPASPAVRKAQNRAAQRAFRERKERHLKELEVCIKELRDNQHKVHNELQRENQKLRYLIQILKNDNVHLRGVISNLNATLAEKTTDQVMPPSDNGLNTSAFASTESTLTTPVPFSRCFLDASYQREPIAFSTLSNGNEVDSGFYRSQCAPGMECLAPTSCTKMDTEVCTFQTNEKPSSIEDGDDLHREILGSNFLTVFPDGIALAIPPPDFSHLSGGVAISLIPEVREPKYMFKQYDSRIDRVPSEKLKELMIEQQENYDLDELWELLTTKAVCHGDPQDPSAWELPDEFYTRFPMLVDPALKTRERMRTAWWRLNGSIKITDKIRNFSI